MKNVEIKTVLMNWKLSLLDEIDLASLYARNKVTHKWKAPYRSLVIRELVFWRLQDILSQSLQLSNMKMIVGARILLRSGIETLSVLIYLNQKMSKVINGSVKFNEFSNITEKLMMGARNKETLPDSINIQTIIENSDRKYSGLKKIYDDLCETAHPNYDGLCSGYSLVDRKKHKTIFKSRWEEIFGEQHIEGIKICIHIFEEEYNKIWHETFENMEKWIEENDKILENEKNS